MKYQTEIEGMKMPTTEEECVDRYGEGSDEVQENGQVEKRWLEDNVCYNQALQDVIPVIERAVAAERERTQKNFSLAVHNTCRKHKPEELKALTTLLNEPCLEALTPLPDKE